MERIESAFKQFNVHGQGIVNFDLDKMMKGVLGGAKNDDDDDDDDGKSSKRGQGSKVPKRSRGFPDKDPKKEPKELEPEQVNAKVTEENLSIVHIKFRTLKTKTT